MEIYYVQSVGLELIAYWNQCWIYMCHLTSVIGFRINLKMKMKIGLKIRKNRNHLVIHPTVNYVCKLILSFWNTSVCLLDIGTGFSKIYLETFQLSWWNGIVIWGFSLSVRWIFPRFYNEFSGALLITT